MKNCLVAQSGGPTAVINASVVGVIEANRETNYYDNVYGGLNGFEGILNNRIINLSKLTIEEVDTLKYTPSSGLGSCRYKVKDFKIDDTDYRRFFSILDEYSVQTFFYIGGNDSMDTVNKLSQYAQEHDIDKQIIGIPKTIDNDLMETDYTPGFGSAAKYIATTVLESSLDASVYPNNGVFILETMGRDTGWLAASACLAKIDGKRVADFIYLPEMIFNEEEFIADVAERYEKNNKVFIVASEGLKRADGKYIFEGSAQKEHDNFAHAQLGGVGGYLKDIIIKNKITSKIKVLELGVAQRAAMHAVSGNDIYIAHKVGYDALVHSTKGEKGFMMAIKKIKDSPFEIDTVKADLGKVANYVKRIPEVWLEGGISKELEQYLAPIVEGTPKIKYENGLPKYIKLLKP